jgi:hypothetical protein
MPSRWLRAPMKSLYMMFLCLCPPLVGWAGADKVDNRNFAVDTYYPNRNAIHAAQQRVQHYCLNNLRGSPSPIRFLAVYTTSVGNIVQDQYSKLLNSETAGDFFRQGDSVKLNASCIMIYDLVENRFVSNSGYVSVDLPPSGSVAHWDVYTARYIGRG